MKTRFAVIVAMVLMAPAVRAQAPATAFTDLPSHVSIGETVFVTDEAGKIVKGKVQRISPTELLLRSDSNDVTLSGRDVQRITRRKHMLWNVALIGLAVGFSAGAAWAASQPCSYTCFSSTGGVLVVGGSIGAIGFGVGAAVGASLHTEQVLFQRVQAGTHTSAMPASVPNSTALRATISW